MLARYKRACGPFQCPFFTWILASSPVDLLQTRTVKKSQTLLENLSQKDSTWKADLVGRTQLLDLLDYCGQLQSLKMAPGGPPLDDEGRMLGWEDPQDVGGKTAFRFI